MVHIDPHAHANVAIASELRGASIDKWAEEKLREAADEEMQGQFAGASLIGMS